MKQLSNKWRLGYRIHHPLDIRMLCPTRWTVKADTFNGGWRRITWICEEHIDEGLNLRSFTVHGKLSVGQWWGSACRSTVISDRYIHTLVHMCGWYTHSFSYKLWGCGYITHTYASNVSIYVTYTIVLARTRQILAKILIFHWISTSQCIYLSGHTEYMYLFFGLTE